MHSPSAEELLDDAELVRRIEQTGVASAAAAALYRRFAPRVRLYGLKHLRSEQAAADLVQDVLLMVAERICNRVLREPDKLASFVLGICRVVVIDQRRTNLRRERLLDQYGAGLEPVVQPPVEHTDLDRLQQCLEHLSERERAVLIMTFYGDKDASEVAEELGLSNANVRVIRHRGLDHLRECVQSGEVQS